MLLPAMGTRRLKETAAIGHPGKGDPSRPIPRCGLRRGGRRGGGGVGGGEGADPSAAQSAPGDALSARRRRQAFVPPRSTDPFLPAFLAQEQSGDPRPRSAARALSQASPDTPVLAELPRAPPPRGGSPAPHPPAPRRPSPSSVGCRRAPALLPARCGAVRCGRLLGTCSRARVRAA